MSRTAVLLSGHMRSFAACLGSQLWQVYRHYPDCHFFISTVQDEQAATVDLLIRTVGADRVTFEIVPEQPELALPAGCPPESSWRPERTFMHEPYAMSVPPQAVLRQLWQMHRVWQLAARSAPVFDTYIRCRPDLFFNSFTPPNFKWSSDGISKARTRDPINSSTAYTPWWGRYGGLNDRFALLGTDAAAAYFTTFAQLPEMIAEGCPLHPETMVAYALERNNCSNDATLRAEFCTLRLNGESRAPEISGIDLAHAALGAHR